MKIVDTRLEGVVIIEPRVFPDARGFVFESYHAARYADAGLPERFVQDNHSCSVRGAIRGFHYQLRHPQGKLVRVVRGAVFDVAVDIRRNSPTFGHWVGVELSTENKRQLFIPVGFAHGFCATADVNDVEYKCTEYYMADDQHGVLWSDPTIGVRWPLDKPILSDKDRAYRPLSLAREDLPTYPSQP